MADMRDTGRAIRRLPVRGPGEAAGPGLADRITSDTLPLCPGRRP